jgi:hypothetical protein
MIFELRRGRRAAGEERGAASTNPDTRIDFPLPSGERVRVRGLE